jgi:hypothetical protein
LPKHDLCYLPIFGYDVRKWCAKAGAWEEDVAVQVATSPSVDLNIVTPNGNRLSRQRDGHQPAWLDRTCEKVAESMRQTASQAVVFVGDASLSPGLQNASTYAMLIPKMHLKFRQLNVALVTEAPGIVLAEDGVHWRISSHVAVASLVDALVVNAGDTALIRRGALPNLWRWSFNEKRQTHFPCCMVCDKLALDCITWLPFSVCFSQSLPVKCSKTYPHITDDI